MKVTPEPPLAATSSGDLVSALILLALAGLVVVLLLVLALLLLRKNRRARLRRERMTNTYDDPFQRPGDVTPPVTATPATGKPVSSAVERFATMPLPERAAWLDKRRAMIASGVVLLLAIGAGALTLVRRSGGSRPVAAESTSSASPNCPGAALHVSAAPEIAPIVQAAARAVDGGGGCGPIAVTAEDPSTTETSQPKPDVWIPSSTAWLRIAANDGTMFNAAGDPMAYSPIVLAGPKPIVGLYAKDGKTEWAAIVDGVAKHKIPAVSMPDPLKSTIGLLSVYGVNTAMGKTTPDDGIARLRALILRSRLKDPAADPATLLTRDASETDGTSAIYDVGVFPVTEQQFAAYQKAAKGAELSASVPVDGITQADYPYAEAGTITQTQRMLSTRLRAAISPDALTAAGFRTSGVRQALAIPATPAQLLTPALQWSQYKTLNFQVLLLIDASGSMNQKITDKAGRVTTKAGLLRQSGASAAQLFGEDTSIGMWVFATPSATSPAHTQIVPFGPLTGAVGGKSRRDVLAAGIASYKPTNSAGTPLYQSVLDGEAAMRRIAKKGAVTLVVVLTDGKDEQSRFAMTNEQFLAKLAAARNPALPVPILAVGYGADADMNALGSMAKATGGKAVGASNPADVSSAIAQAFLAAHAPS